MSAKGWRDEAIDPLTRRRLRGSVTVESSGDIEIRLPHRLESPNKTLWAHWRVKARVKKAWEARVRLAIADSAGLMSVATFGDHPLAALGVAPVRERRRVFIERHVPSARHFIRDTDNLVFAGKPLLDCLRQLGFLRDDSSEWTDLQRPRQLVDPEGRDWTVVRVEIPEDVQFPMLAEAIALAQKARR